MARDAMVFAMANPTPEVTPEEAAPYARVIATGRSDYPNQINNVLCFPGIFRGALDVRAREITEAMKMAAAAGIAAIVGDDELREDYVIPSAFNRDVAPAVAEAVARGARERRRGGRRGRVRLRAGRHVRVPRRLRLSARRTRTSGVLLTGATGRIGTRLVSALRRRGDDVTVLSRDRRGRASLGVEAVAWRPTRRSPRRRPRSPADVIHLAGEDVAQRWTDEAKRRCSRRASWGRATSSPGSPPNRGPVCSSPPRRWAITARTATSPSRRPPRPGDFLAGVCVAWERGPPQPRRSACASCACAPAWCSITEEARSPRCCRSSASDRRPRRRWAQRLPWIHVDDLVGMYLAALDGGGLDRPGQRDGARPADQRGVRQALGRALPADGRAVRGSRSGALGEMADIVISGQRACPGARRTASARAPSRRRSKRPGPGDGAAQEISALRRFGRSCRCVFVCHVRTGTTSLGRVTVGP